jgi:PAS domain S-box-containing protein
MGIDNRKFLLTSAVDLRRQAEARLCAKTPELHPPRTKEETQRLVHELEVHQIELEMQNAELRLAQEELELSRDTYAELYDFAPVGYFTFDSRGQIREVNLTGAHLLGIERRLLVNKPFARFIADADGREIFTGHLERVLQRNGMQRCEIRLTGKDGTVIHGQLQSVSVDTGESKDGHILCSIVDGTIGKQLETEIQEARKYAENVVETVRKPLVVLNSDLKILTANHSFYETFKVTPEETIGHFIYDLGNRQWDIPKLRVLLNKILLHDTVFNDYEVEHDFQNIGRKIILLNARQILHEKIGSHIILLAMEDITERKFAAAEIERLNLSLAARAVELELQNAELEETYHDLEVETSARHRSMEELREKEQLLIQQSRMAAMGEMLGNIAHQWRQPLNVLGIKVQELGLSFEYGELSKELLESNIAMAMEILQHLSQTITVFQNFTVPDKEKSLFRLEQVIANTVQIIDESLKKDGITLKVSSTGDPQVNGYPNEYSQVIMSLILNAKDAFLEQRTAHPRITVCSWSENDRSVLTITDNGGGIKEKIMDKIFDPYFTTKALGKGTGVGLFLSKAIIEKNMGGRITVRTIENGSEFRIEV